MPDRPFALTQCSSIVCRPRPDKRKRKYTPPVDRLDTLLDVTPKRGLISRACHLQRQIIAPIKAVILSGVRHQPNAFEGPPIPLNHGTNAIRHFQRYFPAMTCLRVLCGLSLRLRLKAFLQLTLVLPPLVHPKFETRNSKLLQRPCPLPRFPHKVRILHRRQINFYIRQRTFNRRSRQSRRRRQI